MAANMLNRLINHGRTAPGLGIRQILAARTFSQTPFSRNTQAQTPPLATNAPPKGPANNKVVLWKMYGMFHPHNTMASLVAVVEDQDFMRKNPLMSFNEKVLYYMQLPHHTKIHVSAGQLGFRKSQRSEYEAGYQVTTHLFKQMEEKKLIGPNDKIELVLKDFGKGREAFLAALQGKEGSKIRNNIVRISDNTKLQFGGSRPKKLRRL